MNLILANIVGFLTIHWRTALLVAAAVLFVVFAVIAFKSCGGKREVKIDEAAIQKINSENERTRRAELEKIVLENQETISTVDERNRLSDVNRIEREAAIDEKVKVADRAIEDAKKQGKDISESELKCLLIPSNCQ
jgi:hypothetical protein